MGGRKPAHGLFAWSRAHLHARSELTLNTEPTPAHRFWPSALLRVEDWLLAGWVAIASPLLFRTAGGKGPFDGGQPLEGALRVIAVFGVLLCVAARRRPDTKDQVAISNMAAVGPLVGGMLLVGISGFIALDAGQPAVSGVLLAAAIAMLAVRLVAPPLGVMVRRFLVSPFVMVSAGLYWSLIEAVVGTPGAAAARKQAALDPHGAMVALLFLVAFSAVYYAMLIYAPRQVAEREGNGFTWLIRYCLFLLSIVLGIGWLSAVTT